MTRSSEQMIKKLKTKHVWPSVLGFILFLVISSLIIFLGFSIFIGLLVTSDLDEKYLPQEDFVKRVIESHDYLGDSDEVVPKLAPLNVDGLTYCITDKDSQIMSINVPQTPVFDDPLEVFLEDEYLLYIQEDSKDAQTLLGGNFFDLAVRTFNSFNENGLSMGWFNSTLYTLEYWIGFPLEDADGNMMFIQNEFCLKAKDTLLLVFMLVFFVILLLIPVLNMFINMLGAVSTQQKLLKLFYTDLETGGKNWHFFKKEAEKRLNRRWNAKKNYLMLDIQMNKFRNYAACYGVKAGEDLLEKIQKQLKKQMTFGELSAHYAKADFCVLLSCSKDDDEEKRIMSILDALSGVSALQKITFEAGVFRIMSLAGSKVKKRKVNVDELFSYAGASKSKITDYNENHFAFFDDKLLAAQQWEQKVTDTMELALQNEEFKVYIQPKYHPVTEELSGAEALVRWISPTEGFISPGKFIPIFENNGFITKLDDYMISHVAKLQSKWLSQGKKVVPVSVNVSRAHFTMPDLAEHICSLVDAYHTPHNLVELELTESAFFDDKNTLLSTVNKLKSYGFEISMDDFGAGYSSLNSLKDLPLDVLKLDAEFFRGEDAGARGEIVVSEAIKLAKNLALRIVAEGIEKKEQVDFLAGVGCDMIQGFYFAKPMPADEYENTALTLGKATVSMS